MEVLAEGSAACLKSLGYRHIECRTGNGYDGRPEHACTRCAPCSLHLRLGELIGINATDDILKLLSEERSLLSRITTREAEQEKTRHY